MGDYYKVTFLLKWYTYFDFYSLLFNTDVYELPCDEEWEIERSQLTLKEQLGEGAFGLVVRADAVGLSNLPARCSVAVKMLKGKRYHSHSFVRVSLFKQKQGWCSG